MLVIMLVLTESTSIDNPLVGDKGNQVFNSLKEREPYIYISNAAISVF